MLEKLPTWLNVTLIFLGGLVVFTALLFVGMYCQDNWEKDYNIIPYAGYSDTTTISLRFYTNSFFPMDHHTRFVNEVTVMIDGTVVDIIKGTDIQNQVIRKYSVSDARHNMTVTVTGIFYDSKVYVHKFSNSDLEERSHGF